MIYKLAREGYPLVLVSGSNHHLELLLKQILSEIPEADLQIADCAREGCWEADIIILNGIVNMREEFIEKIREVTTQKILVFIPSEEKDQISVADRTSTLKRLLPNSKVMQVVLQPVSLIAEITGEEQEYIDLISVIFQEIGYITKREIIKITF